MKLRFAFLGLLPLIAVSCSYEEAFVPKIGDSAVEFYAMIYEQPVADTKVYADDQLRVLWNADDRITIFNKNTYNQQYRFTGENGDNAGGFRIVKSEDEFITSNPLDNIYAVYPYRETNKISNSGVVTTSIPSEQTYKANSFGIGANTMVSVAESNMLKFKNVGGYLSLKFYGEGVSVSSITLKSNNGEFIAGDCTVDMSSGLPESKLLTTSASDAITMVCDPPIELPSEKADAAMAIFVLYPVTLAGGITVTVTTPDGEVFEKSTSNKLEIGRSAITKLGALEVVPEYEQPNNVIYYTSTDGMIVTPFSPGVFGANIISNEYIGGRGVMTFDGDVVEIGGFAFSGCENLQSIIIPASVTSIGADAFSYCSGLNSINLPNSITSIGDAAFMVCRSLTCIVIPELLTSIGRAVFYECRSLMSIDIPDSINSIGNQAFDNCINLASITIPDSVVSIGFISFGFCKSLTSIYIPKSVTSIDEQAFIGCSGLASIEVADGNPIYDSRDNCNAIIETNSNTMITGCYNSVIPESVERIDNFAFYGCERLESIFIPKAVTSFGWQVFGNCSGLVSVEVSSANPVYDSRENCNAIIETNSNTLVTGCQSSVIPSSIIAIGDYAFVFCSRLTSIAIPESVTSIGYSAFHGCSNLISVVCYSQTPPSFKGPNTFSLTNDCPIYVPAESVEAYKAAEYWSDYADRIQAIPNTTTQLSDVLILYPAGYNSLCDYLSQDIRKLKEGYAPTQSDTKVFLVISHLPKKRGDYTTKTPSQLIRVFEDGNSNIILDTIKSYEGHLSDPQLAHVILSDVQSLFPSEHYGMVFSSHASGWLPTGYYNNPDIFESSRIIQSRYSSEYSVLQYNTYQYLERALLPDEPQTKSMTLTNIGSSAIEMNITEFKESIPMHLDYLLMDACLMGGIEVAYELREICDQIGFSQAEILLDGFNYEDLAEHLLGGAEPDTRAVVEDYYRKYETQSDITSRAATISLVDCTKLGSLASLCKMLFAKYRTAIESLDYTTVQRYYRYDKHWFYDLEDILIKSGISEEDQNRLALSLSQCILYKAATAEFLKNYGGFIIDSFSGFSMYLPCHGSAYLDSFYKTLKWNDDVELVR